MRLGIGLGLTDRRLTAPADAIMRADQHYYRAALVAPGTQTIANLGTAGGSATNGASASVDGADVTFVLGDGATLAATNYVTLPTSNRPAFTATTGVFSCVLAAFPTTTSGSLWDARSTSTNGIGIYHSSGTLTLICGGASASANRTVAGWSSGSARAAGFKVVNGQLFAWTAAGFTAGVSITGVGAITFAGPLVGRYAYTSAVPFVGQHALGSWGEHDWTADEFAARASILMADLT